MDDERMEDENNKEEQGKKVKVKEEKTPMQKALGEIRMAYIAAFISAGITAVFAVISIWAEVMVGLNIFAFIDVIFLIILAVLLITIKSRIAAVVLLTYYLFSQVSMRIGNPDMGLGNIFMVLFFIYAYFQGIRGTFAYHRLRKQERQEVQ